MTIRDNRDEILQLRLDLEDAIVAETDALDVVNDKIPDADTAEAPENREILEVANLLDCKIILLRRQVKLCDRMISCIDELDETDSRILKVESELERRGVQSASKLAGE